MDKNFKIRSLLVAIVIFLAAFKYLNLVFASGHHYKNSTINFSTLADTTNIDLLFMGSSQAYTAYNPAIFDYDLKTLSFNLGADGLRIHITELVLGHALKKTNPKLIVLELYPGSASIPVTDRAKGYQLRALDFVPNTSLKKFSKIGEFYNKSEYLGALFPVLRRHDRWHDVKYMNLSRTRQFDEFSNYYNKGFLGSQLVLDSINQTRYADFKTRKPVFDSVAKNWTSTVEKSLSRIYDLAKSNNAELLVVSSPDIRAKSAKYAFFKKLDVFCKKMGINYVNLNDYYDELKINLTDFKDPAHLNTRGAEKVSRFLSSYIKSNYNLPDRSNEPMWDVITKEHKFFYSLISGHVEIFQGELEQEMFNGLRGQQVKIWRDKDGVKIRVRFKDSAVLNQIKAKYRLGAMLYPSDSELDKLSQRAKRRNEAFERGASFLDERPDRIEISILTKIKNPKQIKLFLYDRETYKGAIGTPLWIKDTLWQK